MEDIFMGWKAYPITHDPQAPKLPSSSYAVVLSSLADRNYYWQSADNGPDIDIDEIQQLLDLLQRTQLGDLERYRASLDACLRYCVEHQCGLRVSF